MNGGEKKRGEGVEGRFILILASAVFLKINSFSDSVFRTDSSNSILLCLGENLLWKVNYDTYLKNKLVFCMKL